MSDSPKLNPSPGPSISHEFDCSHDPCVCPMTPQEPRQAAIKRMRQALHGVPIMADWTAAEACLDALLSDPQSVIDLLVAEKVLEPWGYEGTEGHESGEDAALYRVTPESEAKE